MKQERGAATAATHSSASGAESVREEQGAACRVARSLCRGRSVVARRFLPSDAVVANSSRRSKLLPSISAAARPRGARYQAQCTRRVVRVRPSVCRSVSHSPNFRPSFSRCHHGDVTALRTAFVCLDGGGGGGCCCRGRLGWLRYAAAREQEHG